jgi:hypothetical protein
VPEDEGGGGQLNRRNFTKAVQVEIKKRSMRDGQYYCEHEGCGALIKPGRGEVHHLVMDAMETDKSRKLTAADGEHWCKPCHKKVTKKQAAVLAKVKAVEARHHGVKPVPQRPLRSRGFTPAAKPEKAPLKRAMGETNLARRFR